MEIKTSQEIQKGLYYTYKDQNKNWISVDDIIKYLEKGGDKGCLLYTLKRG